MLSKERRSLKWLKSHLKKRNLAGAKLLCVIIFELTWMSAVTDFLKGRNKTIQLAYGEIYRGARRNFFFNLKFNILK